jgi:1-phosphofructokinase family hexose kinase
MIVSVALSPSVDVLYVVPTLQVGQIHRPVAVTRVAGGKGFNVARVAAVLGAPVVAAGIVGGPSGEWIAQELRDAGLTAALVTGAQTTRSSVSVEAQDGSGLTEFYEPASPVTSAEWDALTTALAARLAAGDWLSLSGSVPTGAPADAVAQLVALAHDLGASVAVDSHGGGLADALRAGADLVKVNHHEAAAHLGGADPERGDHTHDDDVVRQAASAAAALHEHCATAVVTCGRRGAVAVGGDDVGHWVRSRRSGRFPVGSGDAFLAGLVTGLHRGDSLRAALVLATAAGTANALRPGAGVVNATDVAKLHPDVAVSGLEPLSP